MLKAAQDCTQKRQQLKAYTTAAGIRETDGLGNVRELSADEQKKLVDLTQKFIDDNCSNIPELPAAPAAAAAPPSP
jgi:hypothetical protein